MSRSRVWFSVALPLLALLVAIVGAERRAARSRDFVFDIEGYDPRDLLLDAKQLQTHLIVVNPVVQTTRIFALKEVAEGNSAR